VAFEKLLDDGKRFADRLVSGFFRQPRLAAAFAYRYRRRKLWTSSSLWRNGALTYALQYVESHKLAELTNYGQFLERCPADHFVEIVDKQLLELCRTELSVGARNCGCNSGGHGGWNRSGEALYVSALDWLRDKLTPVFEEERGRPAEESLGCEKRVCSRDPQSLRTRQYQPFSSRTCDPCVEH